MNTSSTPAGAEIDYEHCWRCGCDAPTEAPFEPICDNCWADVMNHRLWAEEQEPPTDDFGDATELEIITEKAAFEAVSWWEELGPMRWMNPPRPVTDGS